MIRILHIPSGNYVRFWFNDDRGYETLISEDITFWSKSYPEQTTAEEVFRYFINNLCGYTAGRFWSESYIDEVEHFPEEFELIYD